MAERPLIVPPGAGKRFPIAMGPVTVKVAGEDSHGAVGIMELEVPPGLGPAGHRHRGCDETFYVVAGQFRFVVGDQTATVGPGALVFVPRGMPHTLRNVGPDDGKLLTIVNPAGLEKFFERVGPMPYGPERAAIGQEFGVESAEVG
jgi:mannose-6-phosphate isomerase-like protein (cupin superfamily)